MINAQFSIKNKTIVFAFHSHTGSRSNQPAGTGMEAIDNRQLAIDNRQSNSNTSSHI